MFKMYNRLSHSIFSLFSTQLFSSWRKLAKQTRVQEEYKSFEFQKMNLLTDESAAVGDALNYTTKGLTT